MGRRHKENSKKVENKTEKRKKKQGSGADDRKRQGDTIIEQRQGK